MSHINIYFSAMIKQINNEHFSLNAFYNIELFLVVFKLFFAIKENFTQLKKLIF